MWYVNCQYLIVVLKLVKNKFKIFTNKNDDNTFATLLGIKILV